MMENIRMMLYTSDWIDVQPWDEAEIMCVELSAPEGGFGLTAQSRYAAKGVYIIGNFSGDGFTAHPGSAPWYGVFDDVRADMIAILYRLLPEEYAALTSAMAFGDRTGLCTETEADFRRSGLGPVLVVSGMHLSLMIGALHRLLRKLLGSNRISAVLCMPMTLLFVVLTGGGNSCIRAAVSMLLMLCGIALVKNPDPLNSLGGAAWFLLCIRPCVGGDAGVQLSFAAVAGIFAWGGHMKRRLYQELPEEWLEHAWVRSGIGSLTSAIGAVGFTLPLSALMFGYVPVITIIANMAASLPAAVVLMGGMLTGVLGASGLEWLACPVGWVTGQGARILIQLTKVFSQGPVLYNDRGILCQLIAAALLGVGVLWVLPVRSAVRRWSSGGVAAAVLCVALAANLVPDPQVRVRVAECGSGIAVQVTKGHDSITLLADTGRNPPETAMDLSANAGGTVILLNEYYDAGAVQVAELLPHKKLQQISLVSRFLPDEWQGDLPDCPVELGCGGIWQTGGICVERYGGENPYCMVRTEVCNILIPLSGTDLRQIPDKDTIVTMAVMAYGNIKHPEEVQSRHLVCSANRQTAERLMLATYGRTDTRWDISRIGTVEFRFDQYGRMEAICP
jgi:ComEC/Rec2-related protein